jgi:kumamolisin
MKPKSTGYPGVDNAFASNMATCYNYPAYDAATSLVVPKIGIISFGGNYQSSDLSHYWTGNVQTVNPTLVTIPVPNTYTPPAFGTDPDSDIENALDIQVSGGTCNNAFIHFYSTANNLLNMYQVVERAMTDGINVLSISWGTEEVNWGGVANLQTMNDIFQTAVHGGMTITVATGDDGCFPVTKSVFQVQFPSSSPWVVACGGTSLAGTTEVVWNDNPTKNPTVDAASGGQSNYPAANPLPAYQSSLVIPHPVYPSAPSRYLPDIAMDADPNSGWVIYLTYQGNSSFWIEVGGTSAVAPFMAGLVARMFALSTIGSLPSRGYAPLGLNTYLYKAPSSCFNDITSGNIGPTGTIQTEALVGYDLSSGLGSIQGLNLFNFLNSYVS